MIELTEEQKQIKVPLKTIRDLGFCVPGTKDHLKSLGLDIRQIRREGITLGELASYNDAFFNRIINHVIGGR